MKKAAVLPRLFATLGLFLWLSPVYVLLGALITPRAPALWLLPAAAQLLLAFCARLLPGKRRAAFLIFALLLQAALALFLGARAGKLLLSCAPAVLGGVVLALHLRALCHAPGEEYPAALWFSGMAVHVLSRLFLRIAALAPAGAALRLLAPAYFIFVFFALNEATLTLGMGGARRPSRLMRLRNRLLTGILCLCLLLLSNLPALARALRALGALIKRAIAILLAFLLSRATPMEQAGGGGGAPDFSELGGEIAEPSALLVFLEKLLRYFVLALGAALAVAALIYLGKKLWRLGRYLLNRMRAYLGHVSEAYEDTVESLLDWGEVKRALEARREKAQRRRRARVPWDQLDERQRVRRVYQLLRRKKSAAPDNRTARSLLTQGELPVPPDAAGEMADIYDRARYSAQPVTDEDARFMRDHAK